MKTEANALATPLMDAKQDLIIDGLTKREHMAIEFTKALLSNPSIVDVHNTDSMIWVASHAISQTDELINQLNKS